MENGVKRNGYRRIFDDLPNVVDVEDIPGGIFENPKGIYPSVFEQSLILLTGCTLPRLIEQGDLLDGRGAAFSADSFVSSELEALESRYIVPKAIQNSFVGQKPFYLWRRDTDAKTPFVFRYTSSAGEKQGVTAHLDRIEVSEYPLNKDTASEQLSKTRSFSSNAAYRVLSGVKRIFGTDLDRSGEVKEFYEKKTVEMGIRAVFEKIAEERCIDTELYDPSPVTGNHVNGDRYIRMLCEKGERLPDTPAERRREPEPSAEIADELSMNGAKSELLGSGEIMQLKEKYRDVLKGTLCRSGIGEADRAIAGLLMAAVQDAVVIKGGTPASAESVERQAEKLSRSAAFRKYIETKYTPLIGRKMISGDRKQPFTELGRLSRIANTVGDAETYREVFREDRVVSTQDRIL